MKTLYGKMADLIGETPLARLEALEEKLGLEAALLAKLEYLNPAGSVKDRIAKGMIDAAEKEGKLQPGGVIIEPTSGNTGIGLAAVGKARGYKVILTMPDTMTVERRAILKAYGAELVLTEGAAGMKGAIAKAEDIVKQTQGAFMPSQFENPANPATHEATTGPEIWEAANGKVDILVAGVGTGGTITGAGRYLRSKNPNIHIVAVEPADSPMLSEGRAGPHKIAGIGAGFVPKALDVTIYNEIITVTNEDAFATGKMLAKVEGYLGGVSSGAALWAAIQIAKRASSKGSNIVVVLPDSGDRYYSTPLFEQ